MKIGRTHVTTGFSTRTEPAPARAPAVWRGRPDHEPRVERRGRRGALLILLLLGWGSLLGEGAHPDKAFGDQEGPPDCTAIMARGFPVYRQLSATYQWLGSCTPHGLRWSVDFHATAAWSAPTPVPGLSKRLGHFEERITIERFTPGAEPSGTEPFPPITILTKGNCADDPWLRGVECSDFLNHVTSLEGPRIPFQLKLMVEAWTSTRPPLTQGFVGDRTGLAQNRRHQLDELARAVGKSTSPATATPLAGAVRTVTLLEPSANAIFSGRDQVHVRVARPPGASTSYNFQFQKGTDVKTLNTLPIDAGSAEAGVLVQPGTFNTAAWPGGWQVRVRVAGGSGQPWESPPGYPWSEWRPFELRQ